MSKLACCYESTMHILSTNEFHISSRNRNNTVQCSCTMQYYLCNDCFVACLSCILNKNKQSHNSLSTPDHVLVEHLIPDLFRAVISSTLLWKLEDLYSFSYKIDSEVRCWRQDLKEFQFIPKAFSEVKGQDPVQDTPVLPIQPEHPMAMQEQVWAS